MRKPADLRPARLPLRSPVTKGEKWTAAFKRRDTGTFEIVREVGEAKFIETPAGEFGAACVTVEAKAPKQTRRFWYAPGVGLVKVEGLRALTKYTLGK